MKAVLESDRKNNPLKAVVESIRRGLMGSRLIFSTDPLTGLPEVALEEELANSKAAILLALDEVQRICNYPEMGMLAKIRSITQKYPLILFIFSGSEESLLTHMFTDPKQPFYNSSQLLQLKRIPVEVYHGFTKKLFKPVDFPWDNFEWVYRWCNGITFHIQWFCNRLFEKGHKAIGTKELHETALEILEEFSFQFHCYQRLLTRDQYALLKAIARENRVYSPTSIQFVTTYKLKLPANVQRSLKALLQKDLVKEDFDEENRRFYFISDVFLLRWLERER